MIIYSKTRLICHSTLMINVQFGKTHQSCPRFSYNNIKPLRTFTARRCFVHFYVVHTGTGKLFCASDSHVTFSRIEEGFGNADFL